MFKHPNYEIRQFGNGGLKKLSEFSIQDRIKANEGLKYAMDRTVENKPDILILDEVNLAVAIGILTEQQVVSMINMLMDDVPNLNIVLTGRYASQGLVDRSDFVNELVTVKEPINASSICDEGIQY